MFDGVTGQALTEEEAARRKKAATSYDGDLKSQSAARGGEEMKNVNVEEQIRKLHEKFGGKK